MEDNRYGNVTDIERARDIRALRQEIERYTEIVKVVENLHSARAIVDDAVLNDPLLSIPVPDEKRFERNAMIKTMQQKASGLDDLSKMIIKEARETIRFLHEEIEKLL